MQAQSLLSQLLTVLLSLKQTRDSATLSMCSKTGSQTLLWASGKERRMAVREPMQCT